MNEPRQISEEKKKLQPGVAQTLNTESVVQSKLHLFSYARTNVSVSAAPYLPCSGGDRTLGGDTFDEESAALGLHPFVGQLQTPETVGTPVW